MSQNCKETDINNGSRKKETMDNYWSGPNIDERIEKGENG